MTEDTQEIKRKAFEYRELYRKGLIEKEKAKEAILPYLNWVNEKSVELAKKHKTSAKKVNFISFVR